MSCDVLPLFLSPRLTSHLSKTPTPPSSPLVSRPLETAPFDTLCSHPIVMELLPTIKTRWPLPVALTPHNRLLPLGAAFYSRTHGSPPDLFASSSHLLFVLALSHLLGATPTENTAGWACRKTEISCSLTAEHYRRHRQQLAEKGTIKKHHYKGGEYF
jgi:hypothetical protein